MLKKQYIISAILLITAIALICVYVFVLKDDAPQTEVDPFYVLSKTTTNALENLDSSVEITVFGDEKYFGGDNLRKTAYDFLLKYDDIKKISVKQGKIEDFSDISGINQNCAVFSGKAGKFSVDITGLYSRFESGEVYAFDGEKAFTEAILKAAGQENSALELPKRGMNGFDGDGDFVAPGGKIFLYKNIGRDDVQSIKITNQKDSFELYRNNDNKLYFKNAELCDYNKEKMASLIVNCTYVQSFQKLSGDFEKYGVADNDKNTTATIQVLTLKKDLHKIIVGKKTADGRGYYARYVGKDHIYVIDRDIENDVLGPLTDILMPNLVYGVSQQNEIYQIDNILFKKFNYAEGGKDTDVIGLLVHKIEASANILNYNKKQTPELLMDKKRFDAKKNSISSWQSDEGLLGFTASSGSEISFDLEPENFAQNGKYAVEFGIIRDDATGAKLPSYVKVEMHTGDGFKDTGAKLENLSQNDGSYKRYKLEFESDKPVKWIKIRFAAPEGGFIVLDEITSYADGKDSIPEDTITSIWKLVAPTEFLPAGKNYIYPNIDTFVNLVTGASSLVGDKVVAYNLNVDLLKEYKLDKPAKAVSYTFKDLTVYVWFSEKNENGKYYAYSTISGKDEKGETINMSTDIIAEVSPEKAPWLEYEPLAFLDSGIFSMYIDKINEMNMIFGDKEFNFALGKNENGELDRVSCNGQKVDLQNFRYLYVSILNLNLEGEYDTKDQNPVEMFRLQVKSVNKTDEIIFYRVSSSKAYYTKNGEGKYYLLVDGINQIRTNIDLLLAGKPVPHK